jgi:hypothetical protein
MTWREVASFLAARSKKGGFVMSVDQLDAWVHAYLEDVFNGHNLQSLDKYMTANLVSHWLGDRSLHGPEAWREAMSNFFDAFPDAAYTLNDLFFSAAGQADVARCRWNGPARRRPANPARWGTKQR